MGDRRMFRSGRSRTNDAVDAVDAVGAVAAPLVAREVPSGSPQAVDQSCVRVLKTVHGVISEVSLGTRGDAPALEVRLAATDSDTGVADQVTLVWLGRTQISGISPGREIVATARICDEGESRVMYNPRYELR